MGQPLFHCALWKKKAIRTTKRSPVAHISSFWCLFAVARTSLCGAWFGWSGTLPHYMYPLVDPVLSYQHNRCFRIKTKRTYSKIDSSSFVVTELFFSNIFLKYFMRGFCFDDFTIVTTRHFHVLASWSGYEVLPNEWFLEKFWKPNEN